MDNARQLLNAIHVIYGAPGSSQGWSEALHTVAPLVGGSAGVYLRINRHTLSTEASGLTGFDADDARAYIGAQAAQKDIRLAYLHNLVPGEVFREFEYVTDRAAYDRSEWIRDQLERHGVYWCLSAHVSRNGLWNDYLSINGVKERGSFSDHEKALMQSMLPHFERAAELDRLVNGLAQRFRAVLSVLDRFLVGLAILDQDQRCVVANLAVRQTAERSGAYRLQTNRMRLCEHDTDRRFQALVCRVLSTIRKQGGSDGGRLLVQKRSAGTPLLLEAMPIRADGCPDGDNIQGCAVFVIDPDHSRFVSLQGLAAIFGLTGAETAVADAIVNGMTPQEVAELRGTSLETVRCQLKSVFGKTGSNGQGELIRLAVKSDPPFDTGGSLPVG